MPRYGGEAPTRRCLLYDRSGGTVCFRLPRPSEQFHAYSCRDIPGAQTSCAAASTIFSARTELLGGIGFYPRYTPITEESNDF